jgi:hypothetical protein
MALQWQLLSHLTPPFHEHPVLASMIFIHPALQLGSHPPTSQSTAIHKQMMTTTFPTLLHLTLPTPTTSLESYHITLKSIIQLRTKHIPSPWSEYLPSVQPQRLQWLIWVQMCVSPAIHPF